jgi:dolichyl-diphosphooligosaccharide--protein glycosyltransferase
MTDVREATATLLADRPELNEDLSVILDIDNSQETWAFEDIPLDSGTFGELVSREIVIKVDGEYQLADAEAVRSALNGTQDTGSASDSLDFDIQALRSRVLSFSPSVVVGLLTVLSLVVAMRTVFSWGAVFRGEYIVLLGNDPYFYRHLLEDLVATNPSLSELPNSETLTIAVLYTAAGLLGGSTDAAGTVLAWYPVIAAVIAGIFIYITTSTVFEDARVALASVAFYAVTPIVAYRSALGYGDHHAFDYMLVALTVAGLTALASDRRPWRTVSLRRLAGLAALSVGVASLIHAWRGGALLVLPLAGYVLFANASAVQTTISPLRENLWVLAALALGAGLTFVPHELYGWYDTTRTIVPVLLFTVSIVATAISELAHRYGLSPRLTLLTETLTGVVVSGLGWQFFPELREALRRGTDMVMRTSQSSIAETYSLLSPEYGVITTPVFYFGVSFFFGLIVLTWLAWRISSTHQPAKLALAVYTTAILVASLIQLRFAGFLGILLAPFTGLGFVYLVAAVDATPTPELGGHDNRSSSTSSSPFRTDNQTESVVSLPDRESTFAVIALFLLVGSMGIIQTGSGTSDLTIDGSTFEAATAISEHAAVTNVTWPENYVFSQWSRNRVYNYFVSGESQSYGYARSNYPAFLAAANASTWYTRLTEKPTGYVVLKDYGANSSQTSVQSSLWNYWTNDHSMPGLGHYRAIYETRDTKVFELVPGAWLPAKGEPNTTTTVSTTVDIAGQTRTFERQTTTTANGWSAIRVPYTGTYDTGTGTVRVSEATVQTGSFPQSTASTAHWPLNASRGTIAFDTVGGHHGRIHGAQWNGDGTGLVFDGDDSVRIEQATALNGSAAVSLSVTFKTDNGTNYVDENPFPRLASTAPGSSYRNTTGYQLALSRGNILAALGNGDNTARLAGPRVDDGRVHTATLEWTGTTARLFVDGTQVAETPYSGPLTPQSVVSLGSTTGGNSGFVGQIRSVSLNTSAPNVSD